MVQGGVATGRESGVTGRASKGLDALGLTMLAIPDEGMDVRIGDAEVGTLLIGTGEAFGVYPLGGSSAAFDLAPGTHRQWHWPCTR